jgi:hypothetical protein
MRLAVLWGLYPFALRTRLHWVGWGGGVAGKRHSGDVAQTRLRGVHVCCPHMHCFPGLAHDPRVRFSVGVSKTGFMSGTLAIIVSGPTAAVGSGSSAGASPGAGCKINQYRISGYSSSDIVVVRGARSPPSLWGPVVLIWIVLAPVCLRLLLVHFTT